MTTKIKQILIKYKKDTRYKEARMLLEELTGKDDNALRLLAECYFRDLELNKNHAYKIALEILDSITYDTDEKETFCLRGTIYKRMWELNSNLDDLYKSIEFYKKAYKEHKEKDEGFGAINASYLYSVLAKEVECFDETYSKKLEKEAHNIRVDIVDSFEHIDNEWIHHTLAQA